MAQGSGVLWAISDMCCRAVLRPPRKQLSAGVPRGERGVMRCMCMPHAESGLPPAAEACPCAAAAAAAVISPAHRGLQRGDGAIISMHIMPKGGREAYPGLSNDKFFFDTDQDMLELTEVGLSPGVLLFHPCLVCPLAGLSSFHHPGLPAPPWPP